MLAPDRETALAVALELARAGYFLAPVTIRRNPVTGRKMPTYHGKWADLSTTDESIIRDWARKHAGVSFAIDTGKSGITVVDLDLSEAQDAVSEWVAAGLPIGKMLVVTAGGGLHHYFRQPDPPIPNSQGKIAPGVDIRGVGGHVFAPGSTILGEADGHHLQGPMVPVSALDVLPQEVIDKLPTIDRKVRTREPGTSASGAKHDRAWVVAQCAEQLERLRRHEPRPGTGFRATLLGAAMMYGRTVAGGIYSREYVERLLGDAVHHVWGAIDPDDEEWIRTGLDDGEADPWTVLDPPIAEPLDRLKESEQGQEPEDQELEDELLAVAVRNERRRLQAREIVAAERAEVPLELTGEALLNTSMPEHLVPGLLYRDSLAQLFGPPGGGKSFLALDLALSIANGRPWGEHALGRSPVHYIMAEGVSTNVARTHAWLDHHQIGAQGVDNFHAFPTPLLLTERGVASYLPYVERDRPALVVLDTKNSMLDGDENSASDTAIMIRAMHAIRRAGDGTCVLLVDHTGKRDMSSSRGSNAVKAAVDTQIVCSRDGDTGLIEVRLERDKSAEAGASWAFRLHKVPPAAVLVPAPPDSPLATEGEWWAPDVVEVPEKVAQLAGRGSAAARDIWRVLAFTNDPDGLTRAQIEAALKEGRREHHKSQIGRAIALLREKLITRDGASPSKIALR